MTLDPADVLLVAEVVSPGSITTDRVTKPAEYAAAGIPHFWRIEPRESPLLSCYAHPASGTYRDPRRWSGSDVVRLDEPFRLRFAAAVLLA